MPILTRSRAKTTCTADPAAATSVQKGKRSKAAPAAEPKGTRSAATAPPKPQTPKAAATVPPKPQTPKAAATAPPKAQAPKAAASKEAEPPKVSLPPPTVRPPRAKRHGPEEDTSFDDCIVVVSGRGRSKVKKDEEVVVVGRTTRSRAKKDEEVVEGRTTRSRAKKTEEKGPAGIEPDVFASQCRSVAALLLTPSETSKRVLDDFQSFKTGIDAKISIIRAKKLENKKQKELKKIQEELLKEEKELEVNKSTASSRGSKSSLRNIEDENKDERMDDAASPEPVNKRLRSSTTDGEEFGKEVESVGRSTPKVPLSFNFSASSVLNKTVLIPANKKLILDETVIVESPKYVFSDSKRKLSESIFDRSGEDPIRSELGMEIIVEDEIVGPTLPSREAVIQATPCTRIIEEIAPSPSKVNKKEGSTPRKRTTTSSSKPKLSEIIFDPSCEDPIGSELAVPEIIEEEEIASFKVPPLEVNKQEESTPRKSTTTSVFSNAKPELSESIFDRSCEDLAVPALGIIEEEEEEIAPFKVPPSKVNKIEESTPRKSTSTSSSGSTGSASSFKSAMSSQPISKPPSSSTKFAGPSAKQFSSKFMQKQKEREAEAIKKKDAQLKQMKETQKKKNEEWKKKTERIREEQQKKEAALAAKVKPYGEAYVKLTVLKQTTSTASAFSSSKERPMPVLANFKPNGPMKVKSPVSYPIPKFLTPSAKGSYLSPLVAGPSSKVLINKPAVPSTSFLDTTADQTLNSYDITQYEDLDEDMKHRENKYVPNWAKDKLGIAANLFRMAPYNDHPRLHTTFPPVKKGFRLYNLPPGQEQ